MRYQGFAEMDFQRLKRKELQALCKKHHIPANLTNLEMVKNLASLLKKKEKPRVRVRSCLKDIGETLSENGSDGVIRQFKKVRFSPENEAIEFVDSSATRRRKSIPKPMTQKGGLVVNSVDSIEASREIGENQVRTTRSRAQKLVSGGAIEVVLPVAEKKRKMVNATRSGNVEGNDGERGDRTDLNSDLSDHLASESADAEEIGVQARRSLRNREVLISKNSEDVEKDRIFLKKNQTSLRNKDVERNVEISKDTCLGEECKISQHDKALRQSKRSVREVDDCGPLNKVSVENEVTGRGRKAWSKILLVASESADAEEIGVQARRSLRNREVLISKNSEEVESSCMSKQVKVNQRNQERRKNSEEVEKDRIVLKKNQASLKNRDVERNDEISKDTGLGRERKITQHDTALRKSKRSVREFDDCGPLRRVLVENEVTGRDRKARSKILLVDNASAPERNTRTETKVEVRGELEVVVQLEEPIRHSVKNCSMEKSVLPQIEEVQNDACKVEIEGRKQLRKSVLEGGTRSKKLEGNDMRPRRRTTNTSVAVSDGRDWNGNHGGNNEPQKETRDPILEETVVTGGVTLGEEPAPTWSAWNAVKTATAVQSKKLQGKSKIPKLEQLEPLAEKILAFKKPLILDAKLSKQEIAESTVLNSRKHQINRATEDMNKFNKKCLSKEASVETSAIKEVRPPDIANLVEIGASKSVKCRADHVEIEPLVSVSSVVDEENPLQDDFSCPNEDDVASHSCKRSTELESKIFVEPEEGLNVAMDVGFPQTSIGADGLLVDQRDCTALHSDKFDTWNEMERDEEPAVPECKDPSGIVANHGVDYDKAFKEQYLLERNVRDNVDEAIELECVADEHSAESNETESTSVDLSDRERFRTTNVQDRDTDEAEKSAVCAAGQEPLIGNLRMQNIEMEPLLTKSISAFRSLSVTYPSLSELKVADGTSNPALSNREKFSEYTNVRGQGSGRNPCLKKQHDLIEACTESVDYDEKRGLMMIDLKETTPPSNSLNLQRDSVEQEVHIPASESLFVTEKENIVLITGNQNLFQGDIQHVNKYDLVSQTQTHHGDFEDQNNIPNVDVKETTFGAVGFSPPLQAEHMSKPYCMWTSVGHFEMEKSVSGKYTQSGGVTEADYAGEDGKCPVLEVQNIIEFQEDCSFSKQSTQKGVCEGHSAGPDGSESTREDCEIALKNASNIITPSSLHREMISSNTEERNNNKAEFVKIISSSNLETAKKVVPEERTDFQNTSSYCILLNFPECEASPTADQESQFTTPPLTIADSAQGNANLLEVEEKSKHDNQFHLGIMIDSKTSKSYTGDKMCSQEKSEALAGNETMSEGSLCVERASHLVDEVTGYECLERSSSFKGHTVSSLNMLNDQPTGENENADSETNSIHNYEKFTETSTNILTNEKRKLIPVERNTDQIPILPLESYLLVNKGFVSSSEHTPLKDDNETREEFNTLFASSANNVSPSDEAASRHQTEMGYPRIQEILPICTGKNQRLNHGELENFVGLRENKDENIVYERNVSPTVSKKVSGEGSDASASVEFAGVDYDSYSALDLFTSNDCHVGDKGSDGSRYSGNASKEDRSIEVVPLIVGAAIDPFMSERESDRTEYSKEACDRHESITRFQAMGADTDCECSDDATPCTTPCDLEYEAFGTSAKELSVSELRPSDDDEVQDEGMRSSPGDFVPEANNNDTSIKGDPHPECSKLATMEKNAEHFPQVGVWDSNGCKDLAQVNCRSYIGLAETPCKESKVSEENIVAGFIKSTSKSISETKVLKEREIESVLAPFVHLGNSKVVFDHVVEFATGDAGGVDNSGISSDKDAKENEILDITKSAFDLKDKDGVLLLMENMKCVMHKHDEMTHNDSNVDKDEVVAELEKSTSDALEKLANRKEEDLIEVPKELSGTQSQIDEVQFHDFTSPGILLTCEREKGSLFNIHESVSTYYEHGECNASVVVSGAKLQAKETRLDDVDSHRDCTIMEEDFDVIDGNSYAEEDVSLGYSDRYSERGKIQQIASFLELNMSDNDGQTSEYHVHQRELGSDAERKEATEIVEVDLFDDFGFAVSSLVPINCNENRGNTPCSMDKTFQEDKDEGKDKKDCEMSDYISTCATDGSNVEENVKCEENISKEQLVCSEDAIAAYHGTMGCGDSNLSLESTIFSSWDINMYLGDGVRNSEISATHFACEDSAVASLSQDNVKAILPEGQFGKHFKFNEGNVREPNSSCFVSDEPTFEGDEVSADNSIDCSYSEKGLVEVEKCIIPICDGILGEVSNFNGCASGDLGVEGGFKSSEGEAAELRENAIISNPVMELQPSEFSGLAADGGTSADESQTWEPRLELLKGNSAVKLLNSTTIRMNNAETGWIQGTPLKKLRTTVDMKENEPSIKIENLSGRTVRTMTKRRALDDLPNH